MALESRLRFGGGVAVPWCSLHAFQSMMVVAYGLDPAPFFLPYTLAREARVLQGGIGGFSLLPPALVASTSGVPDDAT
jgi:hypothetical protein